MQLNRPIARILALHTDKVNHRTFIHYFPVSPKLTKKFSEEGIRINSVAVIVNFCRVQFLQTPMVTISSLRLLL